MNNWFINRTVASLVQTVLFLDISLKPRYYTYEVTLGSDVSNYIHHPPFLFTINYRTQPPS